MKNYLSSFIGKVQSAVKSKECTVTSIENPEELPSAIKINGVKVCLTNDNGRHDFFNNVSDDITSIDYGKWKHEATGRFYGKDWKKMNAHPEILSLYKFIDTVLDNGTINIRILARLVTLEDFISDEEFESFTDFKIGDDHYVIIKAYASNEEVNEGFNMDSILEERMFEEKFDMISDAYIEEGRSNDDNFEDIPDEGSEEQEELF